MLNDKSYLEFLKDRLARYFDLYENVKYDEMHFDLFAEFKQRNSRYMLSKRVEVYSFEENELLFYNKLNREIQAKDLDNIKNFLDLNLNKIINIENDHMSSIVTFIIHTDCEINDILKNKIKKSKYYKSFLFGLKGWVNCKIIVIDKDNNILTNKLGRKDKEKFCPAS